MTLEITPEEQQILMDSMRIHVSHLYKMATMYGEGGNVEAQMDCLNEKNRVNKVLAKISAL